MVGLPVGEKKSDDTFSRLDTMSACDGRTDERTDNATA